MNESRLPVGDEIWDVGKSCRVIDAREEEYGIDTEMMAAPIVKFDDRIVFSTEVYFGEVNLVCKNKDDENKYYLPIVAAKVYFVSNQAGNRVVFCDEKMSFDLPIEGRREQRRWSELIREVADANDQLDKERIEEEYLLENEEDDMDEEVYPEISSDEKIENVIWEPGWRAEEVLRAVSKGESVANAVFRLRGRLGDILG